MIPLIAKTLIVIKAEWPLITKTKHNNLVLKSLLRNTWQVICSQFLMNWSWQETCQRMGAGKLAWDVIGGCLHLKTNHRSCWLPNVQSFYGLVIAPLEWFIDNWCNQRFFIGAWIVCLEKVTQQSLNLISILRNSELPIQAIPVIHSSRHRISLFS